MGSESSLWKTVQKNMKGFWEADRVENPVNPGMPDVYFTLKSSGVMGWIELKHAHAWPRKACTPLRIDHFTRVQRNWFKRHGKEGANIHLLLQVGTDYFLIQWDVVPDIGKMTKQDYFKRCFSWERSINYLELFDILEINRHYQETDNF